MNLFKLYHHKDNGGKIQLPERTERPGKNLPELCLSQVNLAQESLEENISDDQTFESRSFP